MINETLEADRAYQKAIAEAKRQADRSSDCIDRQKFLDVYKDCRDFDKIFVGSMRAEVRAQPPVQPLIPDKIIKELTQMSNALDCQTPCNDMFPSDWCRDNCQWKEPQEQCWRQWAEKEMGS